MTHTLSSRLSGSHGRSLCLSLSNERQESRYASCSITSASLVCQAKRLLCCFFTLEEAGREEYCTRASGDDTMHYPLLYVCVLIAVAERRISLVLDTVIHGGLVIFPQGPCQADLGIGADGRFHAFSLPGELTGKQVVSAEGLVILP